MRTAAMGAYISSIAVSSFDREPLHREKIRQTAEFLVRPAPSWFLKVLSDFSFDVASQYSIDQISLTRKGMWDHVKPAEVMATRLAQTLQHPTVAGFIAAGSEPDTEEFLRDLGARLLRSLAVF